MLTAVVWPSLATGDEGESVFSLSASAGGFSVPDHSPRGGWLGAEYERGITDVVWLRASASGGAFYDDGDPAYAGRSVIGVTYVIDILNRVPYLNLGVGGIVLHGEGNSAMADPIGTRFEPLIEVGVGLDILSRDSSYGVFARFESYLGETAFFGVGARLSWRWGFF